jgi:XTP/dITP diphosphohydrolase
MLKIKDAIQKIEKPSYNCHFVCALSICWPDSYDITVSGRVDGKYCWPPKGNKGFGYDPIFKPLGHELTFAEMIPEFKHSISHRSIAFKKLINSSFPSLNS